MSEKINWEALALTRFLLAMIVLVSHLHEYTAVGYLNWYGYLGAFEAILGFLVISGLSIGKSISRNKDNYFRRRIQRIYPVYAASLAFQLVIAGIALTIPSIFTVILNLFFLNQVFTDISLVGPAWTLALEVWLYGLAPFFLKLPRTTLYKLVFASFLGYAVYTCGRTLFHWNYYSGTQYGINLLTLAFIWIAGFALAIFPEHKKQTSRLIAFLFVGHLAIALAIQTGFRIKNHQIGALFTVDSLELAGHALCLLGVYYVVIFNHRIAPFSLFTNKLFNLLGNISYPLYLTHLTTFQLLKKWGVHSAGLLIVVALGVAYVIYFAFDFYSKKRVVA